MQLIQRFQDLILDPLTTAVIALGFLYFVYGMFQYMRTQQAGGSGDEGKRHMAYGILGMFIMVSVWGIISIVASTIGVNPQDPVDPSRLDAVVPSNFNPFSPR